MDTGITHISTTIDKAASYLRVVTKHGEAVMMLGLPGIGKTQVATQFARAIGAEIYCIIAALRDRLDIIGLPYGKDDAALGRVTSYAPDAFFARLSKERNPNGPKTVVLFDELPAAPETVMPVLYRLFQERVAGELTLSDNVILVAAGNPASALSACRDLQPVFRRRFVWLNLVSTLDVWRKWADANGVDGRVLAFLCNPSFASHFQNFDPKARHLLTYATPDSWTKLARALPDILAGFDSNGDRNAIFAGYVGQAAGTAFSGFLEYGRELGDPRDVLQAPKSAKLPSKQDALWLLIGGVLNLCEEDSKFVRPALQLAERLFADRIFADFAAFLVRSMAGRPTIQPAMLKSTELSDLARILQTEHKEVMRALEAVNLDLATQARAA